jgi:hypothetical protein
LGKGGKKSEEDKEVSEFCDHNRLCTPQLFRFNLFPLLKPRFESKTGLNYFDPV